MTVMMQTINYQQQHRRTPSASSSPAASGYNNPRRYSNSRQPEAQRDDGNDGIMLSPARRAAPSTTTSKDNGMSPSRPPAQVFTKGTTGAVKTRSRTSSHHSATSSTHNGNMDDSRHHTSATRSYTRNLRASARDPAVVATASLSNPARRSRNRSRSAQPPQHRGSRHAPQVHQRSAQYYQMHHASWEDNYHYGNNNNVMVQNNGDNFSVKSTPTYERTVKGPPSSIADSDQVPSSTKSGSGAVAMVPYNKHSVRSSDDVANSRDTNSKHYDSLDVQKRHVKTARKVIEDLNKAQGPDKRIAAITNACDVFDHPDEAKHDVELYHGAAPTLAKLLQQSCDDDETRMLCAALEMVLRGSARSVYNAYSRLPSTIVSSLMEIFDRCESHCIKHAEVIILSITRIFLYLAKSHYELKLLLGRHGAFLDMLSRLSWQPLAAEARLTRVRIVSQLTNADANKTVLHDHGGLLEALTRTAHLDTSDLCRQYAASALMDLTSAPANQASMATNDQLLGTLVKMILMEQNVTTRESVITGIQNLAFAKENRERLVLFKNGIVLEALKKVLTSDIDSKARRRAAGALANLSCEETCEAMAKHNGLLDALAIVSSTDESPEVQMRAVLAVTKIATYVTYEMDCFPSVLDGLVVASLSKSSNGISSALRLKARDSAYREIMAQHPGVLDTLSDICVSPGAATKDKDNAVRTLMHLVNENSNRTLMCTRGILDALVLASEYKDAELMEARDSAVIALERLATESANRGTMARHPRLLSTIAKAVERETQWEDQGRESEHGYLAKPLLLSLLLAL